MRFVYIDESSFNFNMKAPYGWSKKGEPLKIIYNQRLQVSLSLIAAITRKGLLCF